MEAILSKIEKELSGFRIPEKPRHLYEPLRYTLSKGGKRVRPYLVLLASGITGGEVEQAKDAAIAIEMIHNFTLIHDDIMDNASTRRGQATVAKKWGSNVAILSGDALFALALEQLEYYQTKHFPPYLYGLLMNEVLRSTRVVCEGQQRDMDFETRDSVSLDEYLGMISQKTARLLSASLKVGGLISGAEPEHIQALYEMGLHAGIAFQIQDDYLDAFGNPENFGKKSGGDIKEGKKTFLSILALELASDADRTELNRILSEKNASDDKINWVLECYRSYDVPSKTTQTIQEYYTHALEQLSYFPDSEFKEKLNTFLAQLNARKL